MKPTYSACPSCGAVNRVDWDKSLQSKAKCAKCKSLLTLYEGVSELRLGGLESLKNADQQPVVVDFWAPWCGPCKMFEPTFKQSAKHFAGRVSFSKVNTQDNPDAAQAYGIRSIPTLMIIRNGQVVDQVSGALGAADLNRWIESHL